MRICSASVNKPKRTEFLSGRSMRVSINHWGHPSRVSSKVDRCGE